MIGDKKNIKTKSVLLIVFFISILYCLYNYTSNIDDLCYSIMYVVVQFVSVLEIWNSSNKKIGVFLLFQMTFLLFIGGRFIAFLLDDEFEIFNPTFYYSYYVSPEQKTKTFIYVICFITASVFGYSFVRQKKSKPIFNINITRNELSRIIRLSDLIFPLFFVYVLYNAYHTLQTAIAGGYVALYAGQTEEYSSGSYFFPNLLLFFFSVSAIYNDRSFKNKYVILYLVNACIMLLSGTRSAFGQIALFCVWIYSLDHHVNLKKLFASLFVAMFFLLLIFSYSVRVQDYGWNVFDVENLLTSIAFFLYQNGISLMVFDVSQILTDYPTIAYIQTFIPGATWVYGLFSGSLLPQDIQFSSHLCYSLSPELFIKGLGLGWTVLSDIYLFSGGIYFLFCIESFMFGYFLGRLESLSERYPFYLFLTAYLFLKLIFLPRNAFATIIPLSVYGVVYLFVFKMLVRGKGNINSN